MDEAEYDRIIRECEQEIEAWNKMTGEQEQVEYEFRLCVESLGKLSALWNTDDAEQRQTLVRSLFSYLVYDLDARRIVDFRLKPWVARFLEVRVEAENLPPNTEDMLWPRRESNPRHQV